MIRLTRLNGKEFVVNCDLIKFVEETPDTVITLADGDKLMVREKIETIIERVTEYRKRIFHCLYHDIPDNRPNNKQANR